MAKYSREPGHLEVDALLDIAVNDLSLNPDSYATAPFHGSEYEQSEAAQEEGYSDEFAVSAIGSFMGAPGQVIGASVSSRFVYPSYGISHQQLGEFEENSYSIVSQLKRIPRVDVFEVMGRAGVYQKVRRGLDTRQFIGGIITFVRPVDQKLRSEFTIDRTFFKTMNLLKSCVERDRDETGVFHADQLSLAGYDGDYKNQNLLAGVALAAVLPSSIGETSLPDNRLSRMLAEFSKN